ncbi:MAG: hypothetical protein IPL65_04695 [Lewinellaceae bacterium]|nr:hypothetical protein [Lewinellaceae bacterium]
MRLMYLSLVALFCTTGLIAQNSPNFWTPVALERVQLPEGAERAFEPTAYHAYQLSYDNLVLALSTAPMEFTAAAKSSPVRITLPRADGSLETFALCNSPVMSEVTAARHPDIQTFAGFSMTDPSVKVKCSYSPYVGFKAMIRRGDKGVEYIEKLAKNQNAYYMVYDRMDYPIHETSNLSREVRVMPGYERVAPDERYGRKCPRPTAAQNLT